MNAFEAAESNGVAGALGEELEQLFNSQNRGGSGTDIPATYLTATATRA